MNRIILSAILMAMLAVSCKHEIIQPPVPWDGSCNPDTVYFERDILPILTSNCAKSGCHDDATAEEDIILSSWINVKSTVIDKGEIKPGDPGNSDLYEKITENDPDDRMPPPPNSPLTQDQIDLIYKWILQGAQNLTCTDSSCDTTDVKYSTHIRPLLDTRCVGCHSGPTPGGGINFTLHADAAANTDRIWGAVNHIPGFTPMPQSTPQQKLPDCDIAKLRIWIDDGAPNN